MCHANVPIGMPSLRKGQQSKNKKIRNHKRGKHTIIQMKKCRMKKSLRHLVLTNMVYMIKDEAGQSQT